MLKFIEPEHPAAVALARAIHAGDVAELKRRLTDDPSLASARIGNPGGAARTLLHVVADWPGHLPNGAGSVRVLAAAGADVNARFVGTNQETPLHWAASSDDVEVIEALLEAGADIEARGAVIAGGTPLTDATAFAQWAAAECLVAHGARTTMMDEAALGLMDRLERRFTVVPRPEPDEINPAFWFACHGGRIPAADYLLARGADINWKASWEPMTPLDAAVRSGFPEVAAWIISRGGRHDPGSA